jgi:hypothetical protein
MYFDIYTCKKKTTHAPNEEQPLPLFFKGEREIPKKYEGQQE